MKKLLLIFLIAALNLQATLAQQKIDPQSVLQVMTKVADWQLDTWHQNGMRHKPWDWTNGACYTGYMALSKISRDSKYINAMYAIGDSIHWNTGPDRLKADDYCVGQLFSQLYILKKEPKMIAHFKLLADTIAALPHTESLEWKNGIAGREWAWCDALFMGPPALAYLSTATGDKNTWI